jgi:hypothetical protein
MLPIFNLGPVDWVGAGSSADGLIAARQVKEQERIPS